MNKSTSVFLAVTCLFLLFFQQKKNLPNIQELYAKTYDYPDPVNTKDKPIRDQEKKTYDFGEITFDNQFEGARINGVKKIANDTYQLTILPENEPINSSPWYAFRIVSPHRKDLTIILDYQDYKHRYNPKKSANKRSWSNVNVSNAVYNEDGTSFTFNVTAEPDTTYISAQELFTTTDLEKWVSKLSENEIITSKTIGRSKRGRNIRMFDICKGERTNKKLIVLLSRQHPPEVTGFFALQYFIDAIVENGTSNGFLEEYRVIVYPMLNPDGVDLGHWRHNAAGVDLNRDWAKYNQEETEQVANNIVRELHTHKNKIVLGLDFHSTYHDIMYTQDKETLKTPTTDWFRQEWFEKIEERIPGYKINESASRLGKPISKSWFYTQFQAESMTYEMGDNIMRDSIAVIGKVTGEEMMNVLLKHSARTN